MNWWQAVILGLVQGLTEFLPVSSSGHLILTRELVGASYGDFLWFDLLLHIATLVAIAMVFYKDILRLFKPPYKPLGFIVLASIPAVIAGFLLSPLIRNVFYYSARFLWAFFLVTAILLLVSEMREKNQTPKMFILDCGRGIKRVFSRQKKVIASDYNANQSAVALNEQDVDVGIGDHKEQVDNKVSATTQTPEFLPGLKLKHAIAMGLMQGVAIFPGISRSGSTIFGGVMTKGRRETVAKFSFLMSIPIVLGAVLMDLVQGARGSGAGPSAAVIPWYGYLLGFMVSLLVGYFAIKIMMRLISKADFKWFSLYLFALSIFCFFFFFLPTFR